MKLKNILIIVSDIEKSKAFYRDLFGLMVASDFGENVVMSEGLVLQEKKVWESAIGLEVKMGGNNAELYFEEADIEGFLKKAAELGYAKNIIDVDSINVNEHRVVRLFDPDMHLIEVGEN